MKLVHKAHFETLKDVVELMSVAGWIALLTDLLWCLRDWVVAGYPLDLVFVAFGLTVALVLLSYGIYLYHRQLSTRLLNAMKKEALKNVKRKFQHRRTNNDTV